MGCVKNETLQTTELKEQEEKTGGCLIVSPSFNKCSHDLYWSVLFHNGLPEMLRRPQFQWIIGFPNDHSGVESPLSRHTQDPEFSYKKLIEICHTMNKKQSITMVVYSQEWHKIYGGCPKYLFPDSPQSLSQSRSNRGTTVSNRGRVCSSLIRSYT